CQDPPVAAYRRLFAGGGVAQESGPSLRGTVLEDGPDRWVQWQTGWGSERAGSEVGALPRGAQGAL
ncbi:MAG: hypothetical protein N3E42_02555, partial [Candidatus Bipolaricaulota bacterium]|nr:hypothetical protein [Candidatus Bipolaricaulota bacterium]